MTDLSQSNGEANWEQLHVLCQSIGHPAYEEVTLWREAPPYYTCACEMFQISGVTFRLMDSS